jgi:hypothetical protein
MLKQALKSKLNIQINEKARDAGFFYAMTTAGHRILVRSCALE